MGQPPPPRSSSPSAPPHRQRSACTPFPSSAKPAHNASEQATRRPRLAPFEPPLPRSHRSKAPSDDSVHERHKESKSSDPDLRRPARSSAPAAPHYPPPPVSPRDSCSRANKR